MKFLNKQIELLHNKYIEAIFQVAHIEDRGITFPKTYEIINNLDKAEQELPKRQIDIVLGIKRAYQYVIEIANSIEPITTRDLQNINRLINEYESDIKAGE
jgi:Fic family protein